MKKRADDRYAQRPPAAYARPPPPTTSRQVQQTAEDVEPEEDEDDGYGPALPDTVTPSSNRRVGPAIPNFQDLQQTREAAEEDRAARRADLRYERKEERKAAQERLDELAPPRRTWLTRAAIGEEARDGGCESQLPGREVARC